MSIMGDELSFNVAWPTVVFLLYYCFLWTLKELNVVREVKALSFSFDYKMFASLVLFL